MKGRLPTGKTPTQTTPHRGCVTVGLAQSSRCWPARVAPVLDGPSSHSSIDPQDEFRSEGSGSGFTGSSRGKTGDAACRWSPDRAAASSKTLVRSRAPGLIAPSLGKRGTVSNLAYLAGDRSPLVKRCWSRINHLAARGCDGVEQDVGLISRLLSRTGLESKLPWLAVVCDVDRQEAMDFSRCLLILGHTTLDREGLIGLC